MLKSHDLTGDEMQWLLAISRGPLSREAAERRMPDAVRDSLIVRSLARWKVGSLEITSHGEEAVARLRAARSASA